MMLQRLSNCMIVGIARQSPDPHPHPVPYELDLRPFHTLPGPSPTTLHPMPPAHATLPGASTPGAFLPSAACRQDLSSHPS